MVDEARKRSFGLVAELYDRARPGYPAALVEDVIALAAGSAQCGAQVVRAGSEDPRAERSAPRALEVGAGTGKATVLFAARGVHVDALEPSAAMAAIARRNAARLPPRSGRVRVIEREFESFCDGGRRYDLLYSAQAWHWVRPGERYPRARAALRPGGVLAVFWNRADWERCELRDALERAYRAHAPELGESSPMRPGGAVARDEWREWQAEIAAAEGFENAEVRSYRWQIEYTSRSYVELLATHSDHILLAPARRAALHAAIAQAIEDAGGRMLQPMVTRLCLAFARGLRRDLL
jgi:SAM-dependent methyltransferase